MSGSTPTGTKPNGSTALLDQVRRVARLRADSRRYAEQLAQRVARLAEAGDDARAVDSQALRGLQQAEFHSVPVEPRQVVQPSEPKRAEKRQERQERPKRADRPAPEKREESRERTPVVEDIQPDWNGPLPSFLSIGAV